MRIRMQGKLLALLLMMGLPGLASAGIKEGDVNVGVTDSGQLGLLYDGHVAELPEINGPLYGFGINDPGIIGIESPQPDFGLTPLADGANIVLEVLAFDPALRAWTPGFAAIFKNPGDQWDLGPVPVHEHPFWQINSHDPAYVAPPAQTEWHAMFRLLDTGTTGYSPSDSITLTFTPEPASFALLAIGGVLAMQQRRRRG